MRKVLVEKEKRESIIEKEDHVQVSAFAFYCVFVL